MRLGVGRRLELDQPLDLEAVRAQQVDPLAVREVELDAALRPLEPAHAELRPLQRLAAPARRPTEQRITSVELQQEDEPPARAGAAARPRGSSGTGRPRSRRRTRTATRSKLSAGRPVSAASASTSGNSIPVSAIIRRAVSSCAGVTSTPTGPRAALREPRREVRGAAAELDDVEPRDVAEHAELGLVDRPDAPDDLVERPVGRARCRSCTRGWSRSRERRSSRRRYASPSGNQSPISRCRRLGRVRAVHEVVRHRQRVLAAQRARHRRRPGSWRRSSCGRSRSRLRPRARTRASGPERDEVDELAEERLLLVLGVVRLAELARRDDQPAPRARSARGARSAPGSRRRGCAATASGLARMSVCSTAMRRRRLPGSLAPRRPLLASARTVASGRARSASRSTGTPARAPRAACGSCTHDCRSFVVQTGQMRKSSSTSARQTGQCWSRPPSRFSIALISSSRSRTSSRYSGGRKSM